MNWKQFLEEYHLPKHGTLYFVLIVFLLSTISVRFESIGFELENKAYRAAMKNYFQPERFWLIVLREPIKEEVSARGPAWLFLVVAAFLARCFKSIKHRLETPVWRSLCPLRFIYWSLLLIFTVWWAFGHVFPLPTLVVGIAFGCILMRFKDVGGGLPAFLACIAIHVFANLVSFIFIYLRLHPLG